MLRINRWTLGVAAALGACLVLACGSDDDDADSGSKSWEVRSPGGDLVAEVAQLDLAGVADYPQGERLYYRLTLEGREVLQWSPLGIELDSADFTGSLEIVRRDRSELDESYETAVGKRLERSVRANEIVLRFANMAGDELEVVFRVSGDGLAYRYRMLGEGDAVALGEASGFRLPEGGQAWLVPYSNPTPFTPAYERTIENLEVGTTSPDKGWGYGGLFRIGESGVFAMLAEADLDREYVGTHLSQPIGSLYRVAYPDPGEGQGLGEVEPRSSLPWTTPWRVVVVGDLATVFESTLVDDLSRPMAEAFDGDPSWVRPGRSAWSWYSQDTGDPALQREYVDFAEQLGWEYVLVYARWDQWPNGDADVRAVIDYATDAGVGVLLWYNSGGSHNIIESETPRDRMGDRATRRAEFARIAGWGARGIKVDFFQSEKQDRIEQYLEILDDAARERLLVNFHGSTLPRGWQRTYPNLVTVEAVRGAEFYRLFDGSDAIDNVRLAFTRNVVGSMDYTPVTFRDSLEKRGIPYAHQIALAVVFESGIQHFADRADAEPDEGFRAVFAQAPFVAEFFANVPTTWDETRLLDGSPDSHVVVARRHDATWYVAGINGRESVLNLEIPLDFVDFDSGATWLIRSGADSDSLTLEEGPVESGEIITIALDAKDGFVAVISP